LKRLRLNTEEERLTIPNHRPLELHTASKP
jgi:hypothetical protein